MDEQGCYSVELVKEQLVFSSAHFITFGDEVCESLHGHNYGVRSTVWGRLNEQGYVIDFIALRDSLAEIVRTLDHKVLLPERHPRILLETTQEEIIARYDTKRWVFPREDCQILPISNTTAELLASYIAGQLVNRMGSHLGGITRFSVGVDENNGQWGSFELVLPESD
jgi:6-pyruvoyltetrahydropterin/6-carboxytetrahydropterin synthase